MKKLFAIFTNALLRKDIQNEATGVVSIAPSSTKWEPSVHNQYLMDTIKIQYESADGVVNTFEKLTPDQAVQRINVITSSQDPAIQQATDPCGNVCPITISVCGVSIEKSAEGQRIRAIPNAACLRLTDLQGAITDVHYEHLISWGRARDDISSSTVASINGAKTYRGGIIHPSVFFETLERANENACLQINGINYKNFDYIVSDHEADCIGKFFE